MRYWMGIDGGGSTIRAVIVDDTLAVISQVERAEGVNPSRIGYDGAAAIIQDVMHQTLAQADIELSGVGIGIAGAAASHSEAWLRQVIAEVLPNVYTAASSDVEIALVGAMGERRGILLLSGTGSVAFGVNDEGEAKQVGGWGYLLGDEGSGYWLGMEAIRAMLLWADGIQQVESLGRRVMEHLNLSQPRDVLRWIYQQPTPVNQIAACAPLLLELADQSVFADNACRRGANALHGFVKRLRTTLNSPHLPVAFAGGLLNNDNAFSRMVRSQLEITNQPQSLYPPVIGAALLARLQQEHS